MSIYLYVKTHTLTGLKYLGMTTAADPHAYPGSGVYWKLHLKKHGLTYSTDIIKECQTKDELREWGLYYSTLWNIVDSNQWANLKEECGDGGRQSEAVRRKIGEAGRGRIPWNKGKTGHLTEDQRQLMSEANRAKGPQSAETIAKRVEKTTGKKRTAEQKQRSSDAQKGRKLTDEHKAKLKAAAQARTAPPWNKGIKILKP